MEMLMRLVESRRIDLTPLLTHTFELDQLPEAYDLFAHQQDGVLKVAVTV
jgi:threonine dehydrogenase-like Zn-dependent dehydrogenase